MFRVELEMDILLSLIYLENALHQIITWWQSETRNEPTIYQSKNYL
jgi:hypothetical protein